MLRCSLFKGMHARLLSSSCACKQPSSVRLSCGVNAELDNVRLLVQELVLKPHAGGQSSGSPDATMAAKVAQHSLDGSHVSLLANVARQPALRMCDASYIAAIANATRKHAH